MANPGQVPESQWFQLIEVREKNHPADVIRPYQDLIEIGLERASDKYRYPKAVKTIRRLRNSYQRVCDEAGLTAYVADLRQRHRRKTSFIAKLDKALVRRRTRQSAALQSLPDGPMAYRHRICRWAGNTLQRCPAEPKSCRSTTPRRPPEPIHGCPAPPRPLASR
jgi:hypothetical protein